VEPVWRDSGFLLFKGEAMAALHAITGRNPDAVTAQTPALHPGKSASLVVDGRDVATIGAVDPRLLAAYGIERAVYVGLLRTHDVPAYRIPEYRAPSKYPAVERDVAVVVAPDVPAHEIEHAIRVAADGVVKDVRVFDEYRGPQVGEDRKSIAVRLRFQRDDATMTDAEVDGHVATILAALRDRLGAHLRE
jgi:phenylalanyl-tRNA synthetase beta chain